MPLVDSDGKPFTANVDAVDDGECDPPFVALKSQAWWLRSTIEEHIGSTRTSLPPNCVVDRMKAAIRQSRGKRKRALWKVSADGSPQSEVLVIAIDGRELRVLNDRSVIHMEATRDNIDWVVEQLILDAIRQPQPLVVGTDTESTPSVATTSPGSICAGGTLALMQELDDDFTADLPNGVYWAASKLCFIVKKCNSTTAVVKLPQNFTIRRRNSWSKDALREELQQQRLRAVEFVETGIVSANNAAE